MATFSVKAWTSSWLENNGFPEDSLNSFQASHSQRTIGVAFSGGGTRAAACTLGQLKALHDLNIMKDVKYISAVSGGAWAATPYTFVDEANLTDFFGRISEPQEIDEKESCTCIPKSFQESIVKSGIIPKLIKAGFSGKGDESFAHVMGEVFLKPFGKHDPNTSFTYNNETQSEAIEKNAHKNLKFHMARENTPFLIVGATLLNQDGVNFSKKYHIEYTPYYSGVRIAHVDEDVLSKDDFFGGGYITSMGYDCIGPYKKTVENGIEYLKVKSAPKSLFDFTNEKAFSLSDIMASTGAAPQEITEAVGLKVLGFPEFNHIPITVKNGHQQVAEEYSHSDGGHLENLGVMPLLARKVSKIYVFINTKKPFVPNMDTPLKSSINNSLKALFVPLNNWHKLSTFETNNVFQDGQEQFKLIIEQFTEQVVLDAQSGEYLAREALIAKSQLKTKKNTHYGIEEGHQVQITWVYNCRSLEWEKQLADRELAQVIAKKKRLIGSQNGLEDFPHYATFLENTSGVVKLTALQVNLLTNLSYWVAKKI